MMAPPAFQDPRLYPCLVRVAEQWRRIADEARAALDHAYAIAIADGRSDEGAWRILPLLPEPEDRAAVPGWEGNRKFAPQTFALMDAEPAILGHSFSYLRGGADVAPHQHQNNFMTAVLSLQTGPGCCLLVDDQRMPLVDGQVTVFDYRRIHGALNPSAREWIALLMLLAPL
jgi:aspartyl/asparaginyl beta-hydroxylase (cupin superfamily)